MQGIDFSKAIDANFTLNRCNQVAQWRNPNNVQNNYYSEIGGTPICLGIYHKQEDKQNGTIGNRTEHISSLLQKVTCLKSYAADVLDTWSISNQSFRVKGGCIQYFNVRDRNQFQQIST